MKLISLNLVLSRIAFVLILIFASVFFQTASVFAAGPDETCNTHAECNSGICANPDSDCFCDYSGHDGIPPGRCVNRGGDAAESGSGASDIPASDSASPDQSYCFSNDQCPSGQACVGASDAGPGLCEAGSAPAAGAGTSPDSSSIPTFRSPSSYGYRNPLGNVTIPTALGRVVRAAIGIMGALFLAAFIWGGLLWMTAGGDAERVKKGKTTLINAVLGLLIVGFSYTILSIVLGAINF